MCSFGLILKSGYPALAHKVAKVLYPSLLLFMSKKIKILWVPIKTRYETSNEKIIRKLEALCMKPSIRKDETIAHQQLCLSTRHPKSSMVLKSPKPVDSI